MITVVEWTDGPVWDAFVDDAEDATIMHAYAWKAIIEGAYGHRTFFLAAVERGALRGVLPLVLVRGAGLGRHLVSMPFMDYGGACANGDAAARARLVESGCGIAARERAALTLRCLRSAEIGLVSSLEKVTMFLPLADTEEALWKRLPSERRNRIRKADKLGLTATVHAADGIDDFYRVFATNMRDLGSPVHSVRFFQEVMRHLEKRARILVVRWQGEAIGAGLMLLHNGMISIPWVSSLRSHFDKAPNPFLYWSAMRFGVAEGHRLLDFGRSSRNSGTYEAKRQWGAEPVQLHWYHWPAAVLPPGTQGRMELAARLWKRLPLAVANTLGPVLRRGMPN